MEKKLDVSYDVMHLIAESYNISISEIGEELSLKILEIIWQIDSKKVWKDLKNDLFYQEFKRKLLKKH